MLVPRLKSAVLIDFDDTITINDTFENVLERLGKGDRRAIDEQYVKGKI